MELPAVWGVHSISKELFDCIGHFVPSGKTILEFGSGFATGEFCKKYKVISIEDDERFLSIYPTQYIHAERIRVPWNWYRMESIRENLKTPYDAVLVDGNSDDSRLVGLAANFEFFDQNATWFFDDLNIETIRIDFMTKIMPKFGYRPFVEYTCGPKHFAVLLPKNWSGTLWEPNEVQA